MAGIKVPPHNEEAEQSVLGSILIDKDAISIVSEIISPNDFYSGVNGVVYSAMLSLYEKRKPIDILTLTDELKKNKTNDRIDTAYLTSLVETVPTAANVEHYAKIIKENATKRSLISLGGEIAQMGFTEDKEADELLDKAEAVIFSISQGHGTKGFVQLKEMLAQSFDRIDELHKGGAGLRGVRTGFVDLDNILSGMQASNMLILASRHGRVKLQ